MCEITQLCIKLVLQKYGEIVAIEMYARCTWAKTLHHP
jgi:hypothetical protein